MSPQMLFGFEADAPLDLKKSPAQRLHTPGSLHILEDRTQDPQHWGKITWSSTINCYGLLIINVLMSFSDESNQAIFTHTFLALCSQQLLSPAARSKGSISPRTSCFLWASYKGSFYSHPGALIKASGCAGRETLAVRRCCSMVWATLRGNKDTCR